MGTVMTQDFDIEDQDSIVVFIPQTQEALKWLDENATSEPWQWVGGGLCVDHRMAQGLIGLIQRENSDETHT